MLDLIEEDKDAIADNNEQNELQVEEEKILT